MIQFHFQGDRGRNFGTRPKQPQYGQNRKKAENNGSRFNKGCGNPVQQVGCVGQLNAGGATAIFAVVIVFVVCVR